ncbi:MAG: tetratricopeptide repeat protein [Candidatus Omnitrophica bacterium]|nr:tetratricopeptide repeat protein [Candidatus Omnitrophota bacterium]
MVITKKIIIVFMFVLWTHPLIFSQTRSSSSNTQGDIVNEDNLTQLQKQARDYRREGLKQQSLGNLEGAVSLYQKAIQLDPSYAVAYNDLGIIYETLSDPLRAEEHYLKALKFDSNLLSAYSNLALFYENKRDLDRAFFYWEKRASLGSPDDLWTKRASKRMSDIIQVTPYLKQNFIESETIALTGEVAEKKRIEKAGQLKQSKKHRHSDSELADLGE